jgi:hypothetical protein
MTNHKIYGDIFWKRYILERRDMPFLNKLVKKLPTRMLRRMYYSPVGSKLVKIYDNVNKDNDKLEVYETRLGLRCTFLQLHLVKRAIIYNAYEPDVVALFTSLLHKDSL